MVTQWFCYCWHIVAFTSYCLRTYLPNNNRMLNLSPYACYATHISHLTMYEWCALFRRRTFQPKRKNCSEYESANTHWKIHSSYQLMFGPSPKRLLLHPVDDDLGDAMIAMLFGKVAFYPRLLHCELLTFADDICATLGGYSGVSSSWARCWKINVRNAVPALVINGINLDHPKFHANLAAGKIVWSMS